MRLKSFDPSTACAVVLMWLIAAVAARANDVIIVVGAPGEPTYETLFNEWAGKLTDAAKSNGIDTVVVGQSDLSAESAENDKARLRQVVNAWAEDADQSSDRVTTAWMFFIGHGTFAKGTAKFNLRGPDVSAKELASWLAAVQRPLVVVNCASSSGPFVNRLSGKNRVLVTATRSGDEQEFARFGQYLVDAITSDGGDLDHDDEVSILEAFVKAAAETASFYRNEDRIATEHALIDDNGDGLGTPADAFVGLEVPATKVAKDGVPDGEAAWRFTLIPAQAAVTLTAEQLEQRDEIESQLRELRRQKDGLDEDAYWGQLETLMLRQAKLYSKAKQRTKGE